MTGVEISVYNCRPVGGSLTLEFLSLRSCYCLPGLQVLVRTLLGHVVSLVVSVVWTGIWPGVLHTHQLLRHAVLLLEV